MFIVTQDRGEAIRVEDIRKIAAYFPTATGTLTMPYIAATFNPYGEETHSFKTSEILGGYQTYDDCKTAISYLANLVNSGAKVIEVPDLEEMEFINEVNKRASRSRKEQMEDVLRNLDKPRQSWEQSPEGGENK